MTSPTDPSSRRINSVLASMCLLAGVAGFIALVVAQSGGSVGGLRRWIMLAPMVWGGGSIGLSMFGVHLLWTTEHRRTSWRPEVPGRRFESVVFYTRQECHLCDEAHALLLEYQDWLPEIVDVDIDDDPELQQQFGTVVPVIECDGKIRFRGRVSEILLRRLLEGTTPRDRRRGCGSGKCKGGKCKSGKCGNGKCGSGQCGSC
ncbi:MAG: glutaredoxin family protein [Planctomycetaceae bacterium]|nr:glutaredoxin family protein [Planctomycetaceae bacterium]